MSPVSDAARHRFVWQAGDIEVAPVASGLLKGMTPAVWHRHTDKIVDHYQSQVAEALEDMFPMNALHAAITEASNPNDDDGVEKGVVSRVVRTLAINALRKRLKPAKMLQTVLRSLWGDAALQAAHSAAEAIQQVRPGSSLEAMLDLKFPADFWSDWKPGWGEAAAQAAQGGLKRMLDQTGITIQGMTDTSIERLGNQIAEGIAAGDSVDTIAQDCKATLTNPSRAFMIADTEVARAMSTQSRSQYGEHGIMRVQWIAEDDACPECLAMEAGSPYPLDTTEGTVPLHPRCRCAIVPDVASILGKETNEEKAEPLKRWFRDGAGGKIAWGVPGDFDSCVAEASLHMDPEKAKGFCANRHHEATGAWPGHAPGESHK